MWPKGEDVHFEIAQFRALLLRPPGSMLADMSKNEPTYSPSPQVGRRG